MSDIPYGQDYPDTNASAEPSLLNGVRNGTWLDRQDFPPLAWTVPGVLPEGTTVLAGAPKVGKSWLILSTALAVASGGHVLGSLRTGHPRPVLYAALEDGWRRLQARSRALLGDGKPIPDRLNLIIDTPAPLIIPTLAEWLELHGADNPLLIVDTLGRAMPRSAAGESAYERDYRTVVAFKHLADAHPGSSIVLVHHTRKAASDDFVDGVSGTLGITGAADTTIVLTRARTDDEGLLRVTGRDVDEAEYALRRASTGTWTLTGHTLAAAQHAAITTKATTGVSDRSADIIELVADSDGIGPTDVGLKLGITTPAAGTYLKRLADAGRIRKTGRGVYRSVDAQIHTLHTINTESENGDEEDLR